MMQIEKLLTISEKVSNGKKTEVARVQEFDDKDRKKIDKSKFQKGKSTRGVERLQANCLVILKEDFEEYEKDFQSQMQSLRDDIEAKNNRIKMIENDLSNIEEKHQKELKDLKKEYSDKIDELNEDLHEKDLEIEKTKTKYEKELGVFRESIQKEINGLKLFDEEYHMNISDHEKALNKMRGNCLKLRVRENKEYSSYIDELDNLGRLDKLMNKDKAILKEMRSYNKQSIDDEAIDVNFNLIDKGK